jgi:single-stranded DNA-binding protein
MVEGRINMNEFTDKAGQNRKVLRVIANRVQILQTAQSAENLSATESAQPASEEAVAEDDVPF